MKKIYRITTILLIFAVVLGFTTIKAYSDPISVGACAEGVTTSGFNIYAGTYHKNRGGNQSFRIEFAKASFMNPCTTCQIAGRTFLNSPYAEWTGASAKMGETQAFSGTGTQTIGDYNFGLKRSDFSLLKTYVEFTWYINK